MFIKAIINWFTRSSTPVYTRELYNIVYVAHVGGFTVSSDLARAEAGWVAMAATLGFITTREPDGSYGRTWFVTKAGLDYLDNYWE